MNKYIILSEKEWHSEIYINLKNYFINDEWIYINSKNDFNLVKLEEINPTKIFIPHWSYIITSRIYNKYECIVFHMTELA